MGRECGTNRRQETCVQGFGRGDLRERDKFKDLDVYGRLILK